MKRKWILAIALTLTAALLAVGVVAAQENGPAEHPHGPDGRRGRGGPGTVLLGSAISGDTITGTNLAGDEVTFTVSDETEYHAKDAEDVSFADIAVDGYIAVKLNEAGDAAEIVAILPEDFDPEDARKAQQGRRGRRGVGQVTAVSADSLTIETPRGESLEIGLSDETEYMTAEGEEASLADITEGAWVAGGIKGDGEGNPVAAKVVLLPEDFEPGVRPEDGEGPAFDETQG